MEEFKWLDENKGYVKPDRSLLNNNGINNSVGNKAAYVLKNGFKIYGLQITGPTDELVKLQSLPGIRFENVEDIDFWYWK